MSEKLPRIKIVPNLFKRGDSYIYRKGKTEETLGRFSSDKRAIEAKEAFETKRKALGIGAFSVKAKQVWPDYREERRKRVDGEIPGRKRESNRTLQEIDIVWKNHLRKHFANRKLSDIDDPLWNTYVRKAKVGDLTNHRKVLKTFLRWCMTEGYLKTLPILKIPPVQRRKRRILSKEEILALLGNAEGRLLLFISLYLLMGMRWTEIRKLRKSSIDLWRRTLEIRDETTRTRKGRIIKINRFVARLIVAEYRRHKAHKINSPWLFPKRGLPSEYMIDTAMRRPWERLLKRAGLEGFQPHDMRATFEYWQGQMPGFTDIQLERMAGASKDMQRNRYLVSADADFVKGLEESVRFPELDRLKQKKIENMTREHSMGKTRGNADA